MSSQSTERWTMPGWIPWLFIGISFLAAYIYVNTVVGTTKVLSASIFGFFLGLALSSWGIEEYRDGQIRGVRGYISRNESPVLFVALLAVKRVIPGVIMIAASIWYVLRGIT